MRGVPHGATFIPTVRSEHRSPSLMDDETDPHGDHGDPHEGHGGRSRAPSRGCVPSVIHEDIGDLLHEGRRVNWRGPPRCPSRTDRMPTGGPDDETDPHGSLSHVLFLSFFVHLLLTLIVTFLFACLLGTALILIWFVLCLYLLT